MFEPQWIIAFCLYALACAIACRAVIPLLVRHEIHDAENERSSHKGIVPRGGGMAFVPLLLLALVLTGILLGAAPNWWVSVLVFFGFAGLSFIDDVRDLSAQLRFSVHLILAIVLIFSLPEQFTPEIPYIPDLVLKIGMILTYVWWINLYNFMDGIDGITGVQTAMICLGLTIVFLGTTGSGLEGTVSLLVLLTALAFLTVNWHPARVFMGDVGSVTLASITGYLLIRVAGEGAWAPLLILPLYYLVDATSTLLWRLLKAEKIWQAHRQHAYQVYVAKGYSHANACAKILVLNVTLLILSLWEIAPLWARIAIALAACTSLIVHFRRAKTV